MILFHQEALHTFLLSTPSGCFMDSLGSTDHSQRTLPSFCVFEDCLDRWEGSFLSHGYLSLSQPFLGDLAERVWESSWVLFDGSTHPHAYLPFQRVLCWSRYKMDLNLTGFIFLEGHKSLYSPPTTSDHINETNILEAKEHLISASQQNINSVSYRPSTNLPSKVAS